MKYILILFLFITALAHGQAHRVPGTVATGTDLSTYARKQDIKDSVNRAVRNALDTTAFTLRNAAATGTGLLFFPNPSTAIVKTIQCDGCQVTDTSIHIAGGAGVKRVPVFDSITQGTSPQFYYVMADRGVYFNPGNGDSILRFSAASFALPGAALGYSYVNYATVNDPDWSQNPLHTWWSPSGVNGYGLSGTTFTVGSEKEYIAEYADPVNRLATIGLSSSSTLENWFTFDYYFQVDDNGLFKTSSASQFSNNVTAQIGDKYGFKLHANGSVEAGYYRAGNWNTLITYSTTMSGTVYLKGASGLNGGTLRKLLNPQYK